MNIIDAVLANDATTVASLLATLPLGNDDALKAYQIAFYENVSDLIVLFLNAGYAIFNTIDDITKVYLSLANFQIFLNTCSPYLFYRLDNQGNNLLFLYIKNNAPIELINELISRNLFNLSYTNYVNENILYLMLKSNIPEAFFKSVFDLLPNKYDLIWVPIINNFNSINLLSQKVPLVYSSDLLYYVLGKVPPSP